MQHIFSKLKNKEFEALIFDFGAVIINIDYNLTKSVFEQYGIENFDLLFSKAKQNNLFDNFEKGLISNDKFRTELRKITQINISDFKIDRAWNSMVLDLPKERLKLLEKLKRDFPLFLLSNTNRIHEKAFTTYIERIYGWNNFSNLFQKIYFSHHIHMRKPDSEIFELLLNENNLRPEHTLFIDDSPQHIEGAQKVGLVTIHKTDNLDICDLFSIK